MTVQVFDVEVRGVHSGCFRAGTWARLIGAAIVKPSETLPERICHVVRFSDGFVDYWPAQDDEARYELRAVK